MILENKYKFLTKIGSGSFGEVYLVCDYQNNNYAAKIEDKINNKSRLKEEYKIYTKLFKQDITSGIPKIINFIETSKYNILVMELLGESLDNIFELYQEKFNLETVLKLGVEIIDLLHNIHDGGFIHRDIKPNNFLVGYNDQNKLHIMDFGLSKQYILKDKHINIKVERSLVGTARYASINVHIGLEPSRRDDLESVGYMLIYFLKGKLPWQGLKQRGIEQIKLIGEIKMYTHLKKLCEKLPPCFCEYIKYCRKLQFDEKPDYEYLKSLFIDTSKTLGIKLHYCWSSIDSSIGSPLIPPSTK